VPHLFLSSNSSLSKLSTDNAPRAGEEGVGLSRGVGNLGVTGAWGVDPERAGGLGGSELLACLGLGDGIGEEGFCGMAWWRARCQSWQWAVHQSLSRTFGLLGSYTVLGFVWAAYTVPLPRYWAKRDAHLVTTKVM
jgi:hypothetical protein